MDCLQLIKEAVLQQYGVDVTERTRKRSVADARFAVMNALAERFNYSQVGKAFGMQHGSVIHATKQHEYLNKTQTAYAAIYSLSREVMDKQGVVDTKTVAELQAELAQVKEMLQATKLRNERLAKEVQAKAAEVASYKPYKKLYFQLGEAV